MHDIPPQRGGPPREEQEEVIKQAYEVLRPAFLSDQAVWLNLHDRHEVLSDSFAEAWAEREELTSVEIATTRIQELLDDNARKKRNERRNRRRRESPSPALDAHARADSDEDEADVPEEVLAEASEDMKELWALLSKRLKGRQLEVMLLHYGADGPPMEPSAIAKKIGKTRWTVKKALDRAHATLREHQSEFARFNIQTKER